MSDDENAKSGTAGASDPRSNSARATPEELAGGDGPAKDASSLPGSTGRTANPVAAAAAPGGDEESAAARRSAIRFPAGQKPVVKAPNLFDNSDPKEKFHVPPHMRDALEAELREREEARGPIKASDLLRARAADAASARGRKSNRMTHTDCQNCGAPLVGPYCHACGQAAREPRRAVIGLVQDVFVDTLAIDGKLFRSIGLLLSRPGVLARRFLDGRRVHYSPPFRLYLFASVFFFFFAFWIIDAETGNGAGAPVEATPAIEGATAPEMANDSAPADSPPPQDAAGSPIEVSAPSDEFITLGDDNKSFRESEWADVDYNGPEWLEPHARRIFEAAQHASEDPRLFMAQARENVPRALLLAPIVYGLTLVILYIYRRRFYVYDHFIVSLYMHAALYAYLLMALGISKLPVLGFLWFVPLIWGFFQPIVVLRQAYASPWISVIPKWLMANTIYLVAFALIITLGFSVSLYNS